jgi:CBS domain-containing protein
MIKVKQALTAQVVSVSPETTVRTAAEVMRREHTDALLVGAEGRYSGIVTEVDIIQDVIAMDLNPYVTTAERIMTSPLLEAEAETSVAEVGELMAGKRIRHVAIREGSTIIGLFTIRDFIDANGLPLVPARQVMSSPVHSIAVGTTARVAAGEMKERRLGSLVVTRGEVPIGIVTESDLVHKIIGRDLNPYVTAVEQIMSTPLVSVDVTQPVESVRDLMAKRRVRHLGVLEQGQIVGVISARDLLHPTYYEVIGW